ncbi:glycoside hydrolase family 125 protein [Vibrio maerlii]|uniref:glycoside hydrolase family 125 protein n=1 Tax=Vibrio maerlii TaxID=2231648 RepID=UPI000E3E58C5|nr:glycoside hydrolase family 125 protein [Vibrio maerlii]
MEVPQKISQTVDEVCATLEHRPRLAKLFRCCYPNTIETTMKELEDGSVFAITGDIPAMWLRDSAAQVRHYLPVARNDELLRRIIRGLIKRQIRYINIDPYANAFNEQKNGKCFHEDLTEMNPWVWERKYEVDSLCYPIQLAYLYWVETGDSTIFDVEFEQAVRTILDTWEVEQDHSGRSKYTFQRLNGPESDTLKNEGRGTPVKKTGMTWSGFRPSDDACMYGYLIPSNMFACVVLRYMQTILTSINGNSQLTSRAAKLEDTIDKGIQSYGIYNHPKFGDIYAYETDGYGNYLLMDDANVPSLLSAPYLGYLERDNKVYANTRRFILSEFNPYYFKGESARGIGSQHTPEQYIWHIALSMQALTSSSDDEIIEVLSTLESTHDETYFMHEGFHVDDPSQYTRSWFAWSNSIFSELILKLHEQRFPF